MNEDTPEGLLSFLADRLADDERVARQGAIGHYPSNDERIDYPADSWADKAVGRRKQAEEDWDVSWHTHDCGVLFGERREYECSCSVPRRALADVVAKRAILKAAQDAFAADQDRGGYPDTPPGLGDSGAEKHRLIVDGLRRATATAWVRAAVLLAQPYAAHPDFNPAWTVMPAGEAP